MSSRFTKPKTAPPSSPQGDRRAEVVEATWRVIARDGLEGATMRAIASELGVTTGVLTHYFRDKDDMLDFVLTGIFDGVAIRLTPILETEPDLDVTIKGVIGILPGNAEQMDWWKVWLAFTVAALYRPERTAAHADMYANQRHYWTRVLKRLRDAEVLRADIDPSLEADTLMCIADGVGVQAVISPKALPSRRQRAIIEGFFSKLAAEPKISKRATARKRPT